MSRFNSKEEISPLEEYHLRDAEKSSGNYPPARPNRCFLTLTIMQRIMRIPPRLIPAMIVSC